MNDVPSIPEWLLQLQMGEKEAIQKVWEAFSDKLLQVASGQLLQLGSRPSFSDGDDILASVFESIWEASRQGRLKSITNVDELLWLLLAMTRRKCIDHTRRMSSARRGGGKAPYSLNDAKGLFAEIVVAPPDPEYASDLDEHYLWILEQLPDPTLRKVAVLRMEGLSMEETAAEMRLALSTVQRKLKIVRRIFKEKLQNG